MVRWEASAFGTMHNLKAQNIFYCDRKSRPNRPAVMRRKQTEPKTERKLISEFVFGCNVFTLVDKQSGIEHVRLHHGQSINAISRRWALSAANFIVAFALSPSTVEPQRFQGLFMASKLNAHIYIFVAKKIFEMSSQKNGTDYEPIE